MATFSVVEASDELTHVALSGRLDIEGVAQVEDQFVNRMTSGRVPAIVDLSGVTFLASAGIGLIVRCANSLEPRGVRMVLLSPSAGAAHVLRVASIDSLVPIAANESAARAKLGL